MTLSVKDGKFAHREYDTGQLQLVNVLTVGMTLDSYRQSKVLPADLVDHGRNYYCMTVGQSRTHALQMFSKFPVR